MSQKLWKHSDVTAGILLLLFCGAMVTQILKIRTLESRFMPFFAVGLIALSAAVPMVRALTGKAGGGGSLKYRRRELIVWVMFAALVFGVRLIGFYPAAFLFAWGCQLYLRGKPSWKSAGLALAYSLGLTACIYGVFSLLLKLMLPTGTLF